ncbi:hypothetical protein C0W38_00055 [Photobacterium angustum]|nr:hypothetical protein C0W79_11900 [Photobacterium angustum]PSX02074.1 hypothetical protein C0W87_11765 [Photobacterium angustum]PSX37567.1 hypothetical protein C0W38_00055 [Photobacterium angustum]
MFFIGLCFFILFFYLFLGLFFHDKFFCIFLYLLFFLKKLFFRSTIFFGCEKRKIIVNIIFYYLP